MDHLSDILSKLSHLDLSGQIEDIQPTAAGLGASCDVFTGHWRAGSGKKVAVKKLRVFLSKENQVVKKLAREVYIWSKLDHKNVLPLLGFFLEGGEFPHMVSEWMEKGTLNDFMPNLKGDREIVSMVIGIAAGLSYLHEKKVIHADLKSFNILISGSGDPLLADFGVSHVLAASMTKMCGTTMGSVKGTARWMAIELLSLSEESGVGVTPNEKSDVWAFGMTLYEILDRNVPYSHLKGDHQVTLAISKGKLPNRPSRTEKASFPLHIRKLWDICGNCWKRKPELRPSMQDILSAIVTIQEGNPRPTKRRKLGISLPNKASCEDRPPSHNVVQVAEAGGSSSRPPSAVVAILPSIESIPYMPLSYDLDMRNIPQKLTKEGGDWAVTFNPNVKRRLDVNLLHTFSLKSPNCCVRFSADGKFLAAGCDSSALIYDTLTGAKKCILVDERSSDPHMHIYSVCFSPCGSYLATGGEDTLIRIWDIKQMRVCRVFEGHQDDVYSLDFSLDGHILVSGSGDDTVRIWDMNLNLDSSVHKVLKALPSHRNDGGMASVVISSDRKLVAAGSLDTVVHVWDVETGKLVEQLYGHRDSVYSVAFTHDGRGIVSGSLDKSLKLWDITPLKTPGMKLDPLPMKTLVETGIMSSQSYRPKKDSGEQGSKCILDLRGHRDDVLTASVSHDGQWVISGGKDRRVQFWDLKSAELQLVLLGHKGSVVSVDASPGGMFATGSGDCQVRIWKCTTL